MKLIYQSGQLLLLFVISYTTVNAQNVSNKPNQDLQKTKLTMQAVFIDRFIVPAAANAEFVERMMINRKFIKNVPGFIEDASYEQLDPEGNYRYVTIAVWQNETALNNAKAAVFEEYKHQGFDPAEFFKRLKIDAERGVFKQMLN